MGQYGRPSLATAGLLVGIWASLHFLPSLKEIGVSSKN